METVKKMKLEYVVRSLVVIAIGIFFIACAPLVKTFIGKALAALLIVVGIIFVLSYFFKKERGFLDSGQLGFGILVAAVGVWIFLNADTFINFIPKIFGAFIIISGILNLGQTISLIRYKYSYWWLSLILALVTVGLGAGLIAKASEATELVVRIIGGFLAYDGISNLWTASRVGKFARLFEEAKQEAEAIDVKAEIVDADDSAER